MTPLGAVVAALVLPAGVPVVIMVAMLGMARLEARLLQPHGLRAAPQAPPPAPEDPDDRPERVPELVPAAGVDDLGELHGQRA